MQIPIVSRMHGFALLLGGALTLSGVQVEAQTALTLNGHSPAGKIAQSRLVDHVPAKEILPLAVVLPLHNQKALESLVQRLYDPKDPLYHQFLSVKEFTDGFAPSAADYAAVVQWAKDQGMNVTRTHTNRLLVDIKAPAGIVEKAMGVKLNHYKDNDGKTFFAADRDPALPAALAGKVQSVIGLHNLIHPRSNVKVLGTAMKPDKHHNLVGTGPNGGFLPADIKTAYFDNPVTTDGNGQVVALFEAEGFKAQDVQYYRTFNNLPPLNIEVKLVDGADGNGQYAVESVLDIDMVGIFAPKAKILVYEANGNSNASYYLDAYSLMAEDNLAKQISTSWYDAYESDIVPIDYYGVLPYLSAQHAIFTEFAAQGQSFFVASGDVGAYDGNNNLVQSVQYPGSEPFATSVGGTTLTTDANQNYVSETTWNTFQLFDYLGTTYLVGGASGGGISRLWSLPGYQAQATLFNPEASHLARNIPDVSANASDASPYDIYVSSYGGWISVAGTSASAPLWAGLIAQANEYRATNGLGPVGFLNPALYDIYSRYPFDLNDIHDGSTNGFTPDILTWLSTNYGITTGSGYTARPGYDLATGLGTPIVSNLIQDLVAEASSYGGPVAPQVTGQAGNGYVHLTWTRSKGATKYLIFRYDLNTGQFNPLPITVKGQTYDDTSVNNGDYYYYLVQPVGKGGEGGYGVAIVQPDPVSVYGITGGPYVTKVTRTSATIEWETDTLSDTLLYYSTDPNFIADGSWKLVTRSNYVIRHTITITGLTPNTTYYIGAQSDDAGGAFTTYPNPIQPPFMQFTTRH